MVRRRKSVKDWRPGNPPEPEEFEAVIGIPTNRGWWGTSSFVMAKACAEEMESMVLAAFPGITTRAEELPVSEGPDADMIDEWVGEHAEEAIQRALANF